jgi:hypothetical protein
MFKIFIVLFVTTTFALPSTTQVEQVKASLAQLVNSNRQDLVPGFIRLAFHSCIGGCKGCVDVSLQGHAGLASRIATLNSVYTQVSGFMSKADLFALAGQVAIEQGACVLGVKLPCQVCLEELIPHLVPMSIFLMIMVTVLLYSPTLPRSFQV